MKNGKNSLSVFVYFDFSPDFFGLVGKRLDKNAETNFRIYAVINSETSNSNTHAAQYLKR